MGDKTVDLLNLIKDPQPSPGLRIAKVVTTVPNPITFTFEGEKLALDLDIFEVPIACYPLKVGDRLLVMALAGKTLGNRWGVVDKLNSSPPYMATMKSATTLQVDDMEPTFTAAELIIPPYVVVSAEQDRYTDVDPGGTTYSPYFLEGGDKVVRPLKAGDRVAITPTVDGGKLKYIILNRY